MAGVLSVSAAESAGSVSGTSTQEDASKVQAKWRKALENARSEFQKTNDRESAEFVGGILAATGKPDGMSASALAGYAKRMKVQARELVRRGALESGAILSWAQFEVLHTPGIGPDGPIRPDRTRGVPGPDGLVLYMSFDAPPKDGVVLDESGVGNHGRVEGAQWVPEGRFGGAYQFRITNLTERIIVPDSDSLEVERITMAAWIKASDTDGFWNRILDKDCYRGYTLCLGGGPVGMGYRGKLVMEVDSAWVGSDRPVGDGQWHHVAGVFDGQSMRLYVDGVQKQQKAKKAGPLLTSHWDLCIGNSVVEYAGEFLGFDGLIDEVRIYNRALSANEIAKLATGTQTGLSAVPTATKADPAERLKQVKALFDQGLIKKEDYDKKVKEIMDSL
jgi:hypothetical protein